MTSDQAINLRDLINELTTEHRTPLYWHGELLGYRNDPPLLDALRQARTANIGAGNGGIAAHERLTLNAAASEQYTAISRRVIGWAKAAELPRHWAMQAGDPVDWSNPASLLRAWHVRTLSAPELDERPYISTLRRWVTTITEMVIDPPRRAAIEAPCPECGSRWVRLDEEHITSALIRSERDPMFLTDVTCRSCNARWVGLENLRSLRIKIDEASEQIAS